MSSWTRPWVAYVRSPDNRWWVPWSPIPPLLAVPLAGAFLTGYMSLGKALHAGPYPAPLVPLFPVWDVVSYDLCNLSAGAVVLGFVLLRHGRGAVFGVLRSEPATRPPVVLGLGAGLILGAATFLTVRSLVDPSLGSWKGAQALWRTPAYAVFGVFSTSVVVPVFEELMFRSLLYSSLRRWLAMWPAVLLVTGVFAVMHFAPMRVVVAIPLGLVTCLVYERSRSLPFCIAMHGGDNMATFLLRLWLSPD